MSAPLLPIGSPARVRVRRVVRVQYRLEWEYDGFDAYYEADTDAHGAAPVRRCRARFVNSAAVAYRMAALRLIFARRDEFATGFDEYARPPHPTGCSLCDSADHGPEEMPQCRYHGGLARWLRWRDERSAKGGC